MQLREPDGNHQEIPPEIHSAVKALGNDETHKQAVRWIIEALCGRHRASFVVGVPNAAESMVWLEGRRYVGETLARLIERPVECPEGAPEPPARTMTERARRRSKST